MTNEFINGIIEQMFNKTDFNQNSLNDIFSNNQQYNNELVKLFLLAFIKQFNPDEIKFILQNKNIKNSNLNLVFNENVEKLLSQVNIDINFQKIILQVINSQDFELIKIIYQIIKFCRDHKKKDIIFSLKEGIKILLFDYPNNSFFELSLNLIQNIVKESNFLKMDEMTELIENNKNNSMHLVSILYYIFKKCFFQNNIISENQVFQELYYSKFNLIYLYYDLFKNQNFQNTIIENMFVLLFSSLNQFFIEYDIDNEDLYKNLMYLNEIDNLNKFFLNLNFTVEEWNKIYYNNPYKVAISTLKILSKNQDEEFNFYEFEKIYLNIPSYFKNNKNTYCIFIKCLITIYVLFTNDINKYGELIESDINKLMKNKILFHTKLVILCYKIKKENEEIYNFFKNDLLHLLNDIILHYDIIFFSLISNNQLFDEGLIEFILNNIEYGHMSSKYFDKIFNEFVKDHTKLLNGFILFGHWINKYPFKDFHIKAKDVLFIFQRTIDLKNLFDSEDNVNKFVRGVFLIFKAFPIASDDSKQFLYFLKKESDSLINKNNDSLINHTKEKIEKLYKFIHKEIFKNGKYKNKNTDFVEI